MVNVALTLLYWRIGERIRREVLGPERAAYGEQFVVTLSHQLVAEFGRATRKRICAAWSSSLRPFPTKRLSRHCHDN